MPSLAAAAPAFPLQCIPWHKRQRSRLIRLRQRIRTKTDRLQHTDCSIVGMFGIMAGLRANQRYRAAPFTSHRHTPIVRRVIGIDRQ